MNSKFQVLHARSFEESQHKQHNRLEAQWSQTNAGPCTPADLENWAAQVLSRLDGAGQRALKRLLRSTLGVNTAYSGIGFFETVLLSLSKYMGIKMPKVTHAFEISEKARITLLGTEQPDAPEHVFGDILSLFPARVVAKMTKIHRRLVREHKAMVNRGEALFALILAFLSNVHVCAMPFASSFCYVSILHP